ncbi:hypothetical protein F4779DRAFT_406519 [Xylariaceae sp. FL0662B]|nr:hypothetical protein F4779DRAFT_406519 [Xylariaceae sp. FL0662B]
MTMSSETEETATRSLGDYINAATRPIHTKLNKLIIYRLPLALPPQSEDASKYVSGLLHITPIYMTFESLWQNILDSPAPAEESSTEDIHVCDACDPAEDDKSATLDVHTTPDAPDPPHRPVVCTRIRSVLAHLHLEGLARSEALQQDLAALTGWSNRTLAEQLRENAASPVLGDFLAHTRRSVAARPHVLLAYAWVLYLALFSGGRFVRASLERVEPGFWTPASATSTSTSPSPSPPNTAKQQQKQTRPLRFFRFDTRDDGEDLKMAFKARVAESEALLAPRERDDVALEARRIFEFMVRVVAELDEVCGTDEEAGRLLRTRSRDSVTVERERRRVAAATRKVAKTKKKEEDEQQASEVSSGEAMGEGNAAGNVRFE